MSDVRASPNVEKNEVSYMDKLLSLQISATAGMKQLATCSNIHFDHSYQQLTFSCEAKNNCYLQLM